MSEVTPDDQSVSGLAGLRAGSALGGAVAKEMKAYPGTLTFHDLIRKNKRDSAVLILIMLALAAAVGAAIAASITAYGSGAGRMLGQSAIVGAVAALIVGGLVTMWSWFGGANAILGMVHAKEITPDLDRELFNVVDECRIAAGLPMPKVYIIPETALNAFATGRDPKHGVVAITSGLRQRLTRDELQGVIAHEMAHIRHYDIRFAMLMATLAGLIVFACDAFLRIAFHSGGRRSRSNRNGGAAKLVLIVVAVVLAIVAPLVARLIQMAYSRQREFLADAGAVEITRNPLGLASALRKLADDEEPLVDLANRGTAHLFIVNPLRKMRDAHQEFSSALASHPPVSKRIARLLALVR